MRAEDTTTCPWCGLEGRSDGADCVWCLRPLQPVVAPPFARSLRALFPYWTGGLRHLPSWAGLVAMTCVVLLALAVAVEPTGPALGRAVLHWAVLGLLAAACLFPLQKRRVDLSVAGIAFFCGWLGMWHTGERGPYMLLIVPLCGALLGAATGLIACNRRMESGVATAAIGAVLLTLTARFYQVSGPPRTEIVEILLQSKAAFIPVLALLFPASFVVLKLISERRSLWPALDTLGDEALAQRLRFADTIKAFTASGVLASLAGLVAASTDVELIVPQSSPYWLVLPLAALLVGGASLRKGRGGLATAIVGATWLACLQVVCAALDMPILDSAIVLVVAAVAVGAERLMELSWADTWRVVRGSPEVLFSEESLETWGPVLDVTRKLRFVILALVVFLVYGYVAAFVLVRTPRSAALVTNVDGQVEIYRRYGGAWEQAKVGDLLREGYWVRTAERSAVELRLSDGTIVRLDRATSLGVSELNEAPEGMLRRRLSLPAGEMVANVADLPTTDSCFEVEAPTVVAGVRGTGFIVSVTEDRTEVTAIEGDLVVDKLAEAVDDAGRPFMQRAREILPAGFKAWALLRERYRALRPGEQMAALDMVAISEAEKREWREFKRAAGKRLTAAVSLPRFWRGVIQVLSVLVVFIILAQFDLGVDPRDEERHMRDRAQHFERTSREDRFRRRRRR